MTCTDEEYRFWETDSWQPGLRIPRKEDDDVPGSIVFSRDGKLLAISHSRSEVRLVDPSTGREFATLLTGPDFLGQFTTLRTCFSRDGSLFVTAGQGGSLQLWDLH